MSEIDGVDYHWGPHPAFEYMTKHLGPKEECSGPDCEAPCGCGCADYGDLQEDGL